MNDVWAIMIIDNERWIVPWYQNFPLTQVSIGNKQEEMWQGERSSMQQGHLQKVINFEVFFNIKTHLFLPRYLCRVHVRIKTYKDGDHKVCCHTWYEN